MFVTPSDYSIMVDNLPEGENDIELRKYFEKIIEG